MARFTTFLLGMAAACCAALASATENVGASKKPNIIFILTDDQDLLMDSMQALPAMTRLLDTNLANHFVNTPICCPSRATFLSGRYSHNNVVRAKTAAAAIKATGCMHMNTTMAENPEWVDKSFGPPVQEAGYATGYFGKFLNIGATKPPNADADTVFDEDAGGYVAVDVAGPSAWAVEGISAEEGRRRHRGKHGGRGHHGGKHKAGSPMCGAGGRWYVPKGWDRWLVMCDPRYYHQLWNDQGKKLQMGKAPNEYTTAVVGNATVSWIRNQTRGRAEAGLARRPFFAVVAPHAPHLPSTPAPWHENAFPGKTAPHTHGFGAHGDSHWLVASQPPITQSQEQEIDREFANRLRTLLSVDDIVLALEEELTAGGEWNNTVLLFTSDHGYSLGQLRIPTRKTQVMDTNARVPMRVRMPGGGGPAAITAVTSHVDIGPTVIDPAGGVVPPLMDGASFAPLLRGDGGGADSANSAAHARAATRDVALLEYWSTHPMAFHEGHVTDCSNNTFRALRIVNATHDWLYAEFTDNEQWWDFEKVQYRELQDLKADPDQKGNAYAQASAATKRALAARLREAYGCVGGESCAVAH